LVGQEGDSEKVVEGAEGAEDSPCRRGLTTGDLARACATTLRTVRFYEEAGLLCPDNRSDGGHRQFGPEDLEKLQLITDLREAGLSLQEIKDLFELKQRCGTPEQASQEMSQALEAQIEMMQKKICVLRRLREELASMVATIGECKTCDDRAAFPKKCGGCDVMQREGLPRALRLLWGG
jgi:DNA-binding transcriptional MerR regulator